MKYLLVGIGAWFVLDQIRSQQLRAVIAQCGGTENACAAHDEFNRRWAWYPQLRL